MRWRGAESERLMRPASASTAIKRGEKVVATPTRRYTEGEDTLVLLRQQPGSKENISCASTRCDTSHELFLRLLDSSIQRANSGVRADECSRVAIVRATGNVPRQVDPANPEFVVQLRTSTERHLNFPKYMSGNSQSDRGSNGCLEELQDYRLEQSIQTTP